MSDVTTTATATMTLAAAPAALPWWRYPHVWMVIAGPALVVVAAVVTAWIAVRHPDPVLAEDYYRRGIEINKTLAAEQKAGKAFMPALQGRNHAATPPLPAAD